MTAAMLFVAIFASGCGTPREKTAPCKRPGNLASYAPLGECGAMHALNTDRAAALAAIRELAPTNDE
ncbi:MAG: hypothetical protein ACT6RL_18420 [Neoaquamicrobium sediminum]|uniref:hypothetical protein n=1 Tax=Neoaquamicrobium sediminum TaxID=1849104 RepID=UPI0040357AB1